MNQLRDLKFDSLHSAVDDARTLLSTGYEQHGNWSLAQICRHLTVVQNLSVDGCPTWMKMFAPLRPLMRRWVLPKLTSGDSPRGIRTLSTFVPPDDLNDAAEVDAFASSVEKLDRHAGPFAPHPGFGRLPREQIYAIHTAHAAHHLRFLQPKDRSLV